MVDVQAPQTIPSILTLIALVAIAIIAFYATMGLGTILLGAALVIGVLYGLYALGFRLDRFFRGLY